MPPIVVDRSDVRPETDSLEQSLIDKIDVLNRLLRLQEDQCRAERLAYRKGWDDCGHDLSYAATDAWEAGYYAGYTQAYKEVDSRWTEVARRAHFLGSPESKTYSRLEALRNGADWAEVRNWPITGGRGVAA